MTLMLRHARPLPPRFGARLGQALRRLAGANSGLSVSPDGIADIMFHEAVVLSPYWDSVHVLTLYFGHTRAAGAPDPAKCWGRTGTLDEAVAVLRRDLRRYEADVRGAFRRPLSQAQFDAAVSFHLNTGAIRTASWVKLWNAGQNDKASASFMLWKKPPEIIDRREDEHALFFTGRYANDGSTIDIPADAKGRLDWHAAKRIRIGDILKEAA